VTTKHKCPRNVKPTSETHGFDSRFHEAPKETCHKPLPRLITSVLYVRSFAVSLLFPVLLKRNPMHSPNTPFQFHKPTRQVHL